MTKTQYNIGLWFIAGFFTGFCFCIILVKVFLPEAKQKTPATTKQTKQQKPQLSLLALGITTKEDFKNKYKTLIDRPHIPGPVSKTAIIKAYGEPHHTATIGKYKAWHWNCQDGTIQLLILDGYGQIEDQYGSDTLIIKSLNDY